jgi:hypothetical protein
MLNYDRGPEPGLPSKGSIFNYLFKTALRFNLHPELKSLKKLDYNKQYYSVPIVKIPNESVPPGFFENLR